MENVPVPDPMEQTSSRDLWLCIFPSDGRHVTATLDPRQYISHVFREYDPYVGSLSSPNGTNQRCHDGPQDRRTHSIAEHFDLITSRSVFEFEGLRKAHRLLQLRDLEHPHLMAPGCRLDERKPIQCCYRSQRHAKRL